MGRLVLRELLDLLDLRGSRECLDHPAPRGRPDLKDRRAARWSCSREAPSRVPASQIERNGRRGESHLDVPKIAVERPTTVAALVRAPQPPSRPPSTHQS